MSTLRFLRRCTALHRAAMLALLFLLAAPALRGRGEVSGFLTKDGREVFPIGCYEMPKDDDALRRMAEAGISLVRCHGKADLDRAAAAGLLGWVPIALQLGDSDKLRGQIMAVKDHPALAVWEGPDEIVHGFTRYSGLYRTMKIHKSPDDWKNQAPEAVEYAERQAAKILPAMRAGAGLIRKLDTAGRPIWMNEASSSDVKYVRGYVDSVDIIGCDIYPVRAERANVVSVGGATERWRMVGRDRKPVWMVLQAFSWSELNDYHRAKTVAYPSFDQSRLMAYDVIVHGAKGVLYWGSDYLTSEPCRQSIYALTAELAALQPLLVAPPVADVRVRLIETDREPADRGVAIAVRKAGDEWLVILVNEDDRPHLGTEVSGLGVIDGRTLELLYGAESARVEQGEFVTRMLPHQVKVFATGRKWETARREGRDFH